MAEFVSAAVTSHILMSPRSVEVQAAKVFDGMIRIGRHLRTPKPDVLVIVSSDHLFNVQLGTSSRFLVGTGSDFTPFGEMDVPREPYPGHSVFASSFIDFAGGRGASIEAIEPLHPDHGTAIPLLFANPDHDIPVVPVLINHACALPPQPEECWQLGQRLAEFVALKRPGAERVAVLGAGGLSHWVGYPESHVNEAFDREFLAAVEQGALAPWRSKSAAQIEQEAGNGGLEIMNWLAVIAAVPQARARIAYYEPMLAWMTGMGGAFLELPNGLARSH